MDANYSMQDEYILFSDRDLAREYETKKNNKFIAIYIYVYDVVRA